ncbi:MAG: type IV secretory system conjugative DNA transfer family protein [Thermoplasmata archaeon]
MTNFEYFKSEVLAGEDLKRSLGPIQPMIGNPKSETYVIPGAKDAKWIFDDDTILQKHILVLGAIGSGKTNCLYQLIRQIENHMAENDKMVIFDTKGDFLKFWSKGDSVISIDHSGPYFYENWNIFEDVKIEESGLRTLAADEIVSTLFQPAVEKSNNPFFPKAARDLVLALVMQVLKESPNPTNADLKKVIFGPKQELFRLLSSDSEWSWVSDYLPKGDQASGVYGEIYETMRAVLQRPFDEKGTFSIRNFVRQEGKRKLFFEYSVSTSLVLKPLYSVLYDLAIKEVLSHKKPKGRTFFIIDEFSLLPYLRYIENGINFGRERGARFVIAAQNMNQIVDIYGEYRGRSIASGIGTFITFALYDKLSREIVSGKYGQNVKNLLVMSKRREEGYKQNVVWGNVIEDDDLSTLKLGEAIICPPSSQPFRFNFNKYENVKSALIEDGSNDASMTSSGDHP